MDANGKPIMSRKMLERMMRHTSTGGMQAFGAGHRSAVPRSIHDTKRAHQYKNSLIGSCRVQEGVTQPDNADATNANSLDTSSATGPGAASQPSAPQRL